MVEENIMLADRIEPEVPISMEVDEEDTDGWCLIERFWWMGVIPL